MECLISWSVLVLRHVDVGVIISMVLLVLDLRESTMPLIELALVLGRELLCGDCASPAKSGGVGAAELIGRGNEELFDSCRRVIGLL